MRDNQKTSKWIFLLLITILFLPQAIELDLINFSDSDLVEIFQHETTTAIISGRAAPDGRPFFWKNRDRRIYPDQEIVYFDDGEFEYLGLTSAGELDQVWVGVNSTGFAIENSNAYNFPDTVEGDDDDGRIMKLALQTCRTVEDFIAILDSTNEAGRTRTSNYGIIDADGTVGVFEASANEYQWFDANDTLDAPDGFLVRSNFAYSGGDSGISGQWRHDRVYELLTAAVEDSALTPEYIFKNVARDLALEDLDPYPLPFEDAYEGAAFPPGFLPTYNCINRNITCAGIVVQSVLEGENPLLSTVWAAIGQPVAAVPVPLWVNSRSTPVEMNGDSTAMLCDLANLFLEYIYNSALADDALNTFQLVDGQGGGLYAITNPVIDTVFARTDRVLPGWREELPDSAVTAEFQDSLAAYVCRSIRDWRGKRTYLVPGDFATIQEAVDACDHGDTVLIMSGVYPAPIEFDGRDVIVGSLFMTTGDQSYIDSTIIDGDRNGRSAVVYRNGVSSLAHLTGLTLRNSTTGFGGGIYCNNGSPRLSYLLIAGNSASRRGGGIYCTQDSHPVLDHVTISGNSAVEAGGGIYCFDNTSDAVLSNSIIWNNDPPDNQAWLTITYSLVEDGFPGAGNLDEDPLFDDPGSGNYHLSWRNFPEDDETRSPCIDAGDPDFHSDPDSTNSDIGCFFYDQGFPQDISIDAESLEFTDVEIGSFSRQSLVIANTGERVLHVSSQSVRYITGPPFIYISSGGGLFSLDPGENHETVITFAPQFEAVHEAVYRIESDDPDEAVLEIPVLGITMSAPGDERLRIIHDR